MMLSPNALSITACALRNRPAGAPPGLPAAGSLVAHWDSSDIGGLADGAAVSAWVDRIHGLEATQATSANRPTFRSAAMNGRPCLQFSGSQWLSAVAAGSALKGAVDTRNYTVLIVHQNAAVRANGALFGCTAGGNGFHFLANGSVQGRFDSGSINLTVPIEDAGLATLGCASTTNQSNGSGSGLERIYVNGGCVASNVAPGPATAASTDFGIGAGRGSGTFPVQAQVGAILVWAATLRPDEMIQAERYVRHIYGLPAPWEGREAFVLFHGDSQTAGVGSELGAQGAYHYKVKQALGLKLGQYSQLGIGGINMVNMTARALFEVDPISAATGIPTALAVFEWFNQRNNSSAISDTVAYLQARRSAGIDRIAFGTSLDYIDTQGGLDNRAAFNAYFDVEANRAGLIDAYVPLHLDPNIGVEGACPAPPGPYTPNFSDGIHLRSAGNDYLAAMFAPAVGSII
ncbi:MAG: hypothetical protein QHC65_06300 [Sphingomonas sp.]|nr:hypothetical protein [Sphingomonas sp.]MDX3884013.1 hypothetical protein [Sphingomonas sp.]